MENSASATYIAELSTNKEIMSSAQTAIINYNIKNIFSGELVNVTSIESIILRVDGNYLNLIDQKGNHGTMAILKNQKGSIAIRSFDKIRYNTCWV